MSSTGGLNRHKNAKKNMRFSQELSEKIITHLTMIGREDVIPNINKNTKK